MKKIIMWIAIGLVVLLGLAYLGVGYVIYDKLSLIVPEGSDDPTNTPVKFTVGYAGFTSFDASPYWMDQYEEVTFSSRQPGIMLSGWYVEADPAAAVVIFTHGIGAEKLAANVLVPAGMAYRNGFNVLLYDLRNHGASAKDNGRTSVGCKEYLDVLGAWDYLVNQRGVDPGRIGIYGLSLGGASTLNAFAAESRVAAVLVDSPFANLQQIITEELARTGYPAFLAPASILSGRVFGGVNLLEHSPKDAITNAAGRPIMIIHGLTDSRVNVHHTQELVALAQERGANVTVWYVEDTDHVQAVLNYPADYEEKLVAFYRAVLI